MQQLREELKENIFIRDGNISFSVYGRNYSNAEWAFLIESIGEAQEVVFAQCRVSAQKMEMFVGKQWPNLTYLAICHDELFAKEGLQTLSRLQAPLQQLHFDANALDSKSCIYLSQLGWPTLTSLNLRYNDIEAEGCAHLMQAKWNLQALEATANSIDSLGARHLSKCQWTNLSCLILDENTLRDAGCKYLKQGPWLKLEHLSLSDNKMTSIGCKWLIKANWPNLKTICLSCNLIDSEVCKNIASNNWLNLTVLDIAYGIMDAQGCKQLLTAKWKALKKLKFDCRRIKDWQLLQQTIRRAFPTLQTDTF